MSLGPMIVDSMSAALLVSCRSLADIDAACIGGADIIDLKEPSAGPLGATDLRLWQAALERLKGQRPLTAAAGEALDWQDCLDEWGKLAVAATGLAAVKVGTAGLAAVRDWQPLLTELARRLPPTTQLVPVAYADATRAAGPTLHAMHLAAHKLACRMILVDTFDKQGPGLLSHLSQRAIAEFAVQLRKRGIQLAVAGKLCLAEIAYVAPLGVAVIGVRGAVCSDHDRLGPVSVERVAELRRACANCRELAALGVDTPA